MKEGVYQQQAAECGSSAAASLNDPHTLS